jgi:hypothetical protein
MSKDYVVEMLLEEQHKQPTQFQANSANQTAAQYQKLPWREKDQ